MTSVRAAEVKSRSRCGISSSPVGEDVSDRNSDELRDDTGRSEPIELGVPGIELVSAL